MNLTLRRSVALLALASVTVLAIHWPVQAAGVLPTARVLPPEVTIYATLPNVDNFKERWKQSSYGRLQRDPDLADFRSDVTKQLKQASSQLEQKLGVSLEDLLELPRGEVSFAVVQPPGKELAVVGFLDFGKNETTIDKLLEIAGETLHREEQQAKRSVEEFDDTRITIYTFEETKDENDENPRNAQTQIAYFIKDSVIVVGSNIDVLQSVLTRWDGKHPATFADNEVYQYIQQRCDNPDSTSVLKWYFDPIALLKGVVTTDPSNFQANLVVMNLPRLGLTNIKGMGGAFDMATEKFDSVSNTMIYLESPPTGVLNVFQFPATEQTPPAWVSNDFSAYFSINWNLSAAYNAVEGLVDSLQGPGTFATVIDRMANQENGPNIHIKKDLIDNLTGDMHFLRTAVDGEQASQGSFVLAFELQNPDGIKATLESITKAPGFPGTTRQFQGVAIYEVPAGAAGSVGTAVARDHLFISTNVKILEGVIRENSDQAALSASNEYQKIARHFPTETSIRGFQKQDSQTKAIYDLLRSGTSPILPTGANAALREIDFSKLPPFESVQKYLKPSGTYAVPDRRGVLFVSFSLND